jgi:hypothetical protein
MVEAVTAMPRETDMILLITDLVENSTHPSIGNASSTIMNYKEQHSACLYLNYI